MDNVAVVSLTDPDVAVRGQPLGSDPHVFAREGFDAAPEIVGLLGYSGETDYQCVEDGCFADTVHAHDEVDSRLEAELGRLDGAQVRELERGDPHAALSTSIWPVTAAAMRAVRRSFRRAIEILVAN